jgi:hypothetical protein
MAVLAVEAGRPDNSITALLAQFGAGNREAETRPIPEIDGELRRLASPHTHAEHDNHTGSSMARVWLQGELSKQP